MYNKSNAKQTKIQVKLYLQELCMRQLQIRRLTWKTKKHDLTLN